jgi:hypothetical protein
MQFGVLTLNVPRKFEREVLTGNIPDLGGSVGDCEQFGAIWIQQSICRWSCRIQRCLAVKDVFTWISACGAKKPRRGAEPSSL